MAGVAPRNRRPGRKRCGAAEARSRALGRLGGGGTTDVDAMDDAADEEDDKEDEDEEGGEEKDGMLV